MNHWQTLLELDLRLSRQMRLSPAAWRGWRWLAAFLAHSGDSWFWLAGLGIVWLVGSPAWRYRAAAMAIGTVFLAALVLAIKFSIRRRRPDGEWGAIYRNTDPHSFPSGHAARSVFLAVMAWSLGPPWFAWVLILWAPLMSLCRVTMGVHYLSDLLGGMLVGALTGLLILLALPLMVSLAPFLF